MTEATLERHSDSAERWGPLQRHQLVLVGSGSALVICWLLITRMPTVTLMMAVGCILAACPVRRGDTVAQWIVVVTRFALRSRWTTLAIQLEGDALTLRRGASVTTTLRALRHVGRLDLSGHDAVVTGQLRDLLGALAVTAEGGHVTQLVTMSHDGATTMVASSRGGDLSGWELPTSAPLFGTSSGQRLVRECWRSVRTIDGVYRVGRIVTFRPDGGHSLLEALQCTGVPSTLVVQYQIVPSARAPRIVGRAVHRRGVDESATRALGFRRSAQSDRALARLALREASVAAGHTLVRIAVYLIVTGETVAAVRQGASRIASVAKDDGTLLQWGMGRQAQWFLWALPGGLQW